LAAITATESISEIIIGHPRTMRGGQSEQTRAVETVHAILIVEFPHLSFRLWDERLSSKRAERTGRARTRDEKLRQHAIAAAHILDLYLAFLRAHLPSTNTSH